MLTITVTDDYIEYSDEEGIHFEIIEEEGIE